MTDGFGVDMLPGDPSEPVGPEDALGKGPKRGDYTDRVGPATYSPHEVADPQRARAENIGEVAGKKGGVETEGLEPDDDDESGGG